MSWRDEPSFETVQGALRERGQLRAHIEMLEAQLKIEQAKVARQKPRDTAAKIVGINEETEEILTGIQRELAQLQGDLSRVDAEIEFNRYHLEMYKSIAYQSRF